MKYKLAIFDMDGTIINSRTFHTEVFYDFLKDNWKQVSYETCYKAVGITVKKVFETVGVPEEYHVEFFGKLNRYYYEKAGQFLRKTQIADGIPELLEELRGRGIKTAICTNSLNEVVDMFLDYHSLRNGFDIIKGADPESHSKIERCRDIQERIGISTDESVYVGDSESDFELANAMGYDSIYAGTPIAWANDEDYLINELKPTYVIRSYEDLLRKIRQGEI